MNLNFTSHNICSTLMFGLRIFAIFYRVTSYLRLLPLSVLTCSPNMSFLARLVSDNSRSLKKIALRHSPPQSPLRKNVCTGSEFLFIAMTFLAPTSEIYLVSSNWGPRTLIMGHPRGSDVIPLVYTSIRVINCIRGRILHRFRDIAFDIIQRRYIWLPLSRLTPTEGFRWHNLRKIMQGGLRMARVQKGIETLREITTGWVWCNNVTNRRRQTTTDGFAIASTRMLFLVQ